MADQGDDVLHERGPGRRDQDRRRGLNWSALSAAIATTALLISVLGQVLGWFGANATEIRKINERLSLLESGNRTMQQQRMEDLERNERQREEILRRLDRQDDKLDVILQRVR
jgi:Tfp pilus assembly protein PilN